jgi:hypothetical protein
LLFSLDWTHFSRTWTTVSHIPQEKRRGLKTAQSNSPEAQSRSQTARQLKKSAYFSTFFWSLW